MGKSFSWRIQQFFGNPFIPFALCLYACFLINGAGSIAIAQNMNFLMEQWHTDESVIAWVISGNAIGRLLSYYVAGYLSDKFGRKNLLWAAIVFYSVFFIGILLSPSANIAFVFAVIGGFGNACFDTSVYPSLKEMFPISSDSAVVFCKAAVSLGQMGYSLFMAFLIAGNFWFGYAFTIPVLLLVFFGVVAFLMKLPPLPHVDQGGEGCDEGDSFVQMTFKRLPKVSVEGVLVVLFGCGSFSSFYSFVVWISKYSQNVALMTADAAQRTVTYYGLGSLICIMISAYLLNRFVRSVFIMVVFPVIAAISALMLYLYPVGWVCNVVAFVIGFTASGGLLQLGISVLMQFFPKGKAKTVSVYMIMSSLASSGVIYLLGKVALIGLSYIMLCNAGISLLTAVFGVIIFVRFYRIFTINASDFRWGERLFLDR